MAETPQKKLERLLHDLAQIDLEKPEKAFRIVSYLVGAALSLQEALRLNYEPAASDADAEELRQELCRVITLVRKPGSNVRDELSAKEEQWIARWHFHSAVHRLASVTDRLIAMKYPDYAGASSEAIAERARKREKKFAGAVDTVCKRANQLKHGVDPQAVPMATALKAFESIQKRAVRWLAHETNKGAGNAP